MGYQVDFRSLEEVWASMETGQRELKVKLQDDEEKTWTYARAIVSRQEFPQGERMRVFSRFGLEAGQVYVQVLELEDLS